MKTRLDAHHEDDHLRPAVGVGVMVTRNRKVLLGKRKGAHGQDTFAWPGGGLAFGETLAAAVHREVIEETGLRVKKFRFICVSNVIEYGRHYLDIEVEVTDFDGSPVVREPERVESWDWYDLDHLPTPLFKPCEIAIGRYFDKSCLQVVDADGALIAR